MLVNDPPAHVTDWPEVHRFAGKVVEAGDVKALRPGPLSEVVESSSDALQRRQARDLCHSDEHSQRVPHRLTVNDG
jgi:hypothetical protein